MFHSFGWLDIWGKTPMDLGMEVDELDPWWEEAMFQIKAGVEEAKTRRLQQASASRPH